MPATESNGIHQRPANFLLPTLKRREEEKDKALEVQGNAPNYGKVPVPHVLSFASIISTAAKTYRDSDEATLHSLDNARHMRNDCGIMECLEQRQRLTSLLGWHLEPEDDTSQEQKDCCEALDKIIRNIKRFTEYRRNLMEAIWYGKYGIQHSYNHARVGGQTRVLPWPHPRNQDDDWGWKPLNGDKIDFRFDDGQHDADPTKYAGQMGIRVGAGFRVGDTIRDRWAVESTQRGLAYFLAPWERKMCVVHKHMIEDVPWEDGLHSGRVHGVGIRSRVYWDWFQKQECLAMLMEFLERSAGGITLWRYPSGNPQAEAQTRKSAEEYVGNSKNILLVPMPTGEDAYAYGVEVIEPGMAGIEQLKDLLTTYFGHRIKRYILGQILSSESEATGLGSGVADLHLDTLLSIVKFDATNLEETLTDQLVQPIKDFNFPHARDFSVRFVIETESPDVEKKMEAWQSAWNMGARLKERDVMDLIGAAMPDDSDTVLQNPQFQQQPEMPGEGSQQPGVMAAKPSQIAFDADSLTNELMQELWGDPQASDGQTMTYVAEGGKWVQRELPNFDTGDRTRAEDGEPDRLSKQKLFDSVRDAAESTELNPTDAQRESGNYKKGKVSVHGLPITIEVAAGGIRKGKSRDGHRWETVMPCHYGYIRRTVGKDGDHVDVFLHPKPESEIIFVLDQKSRSGRFDEHKVFVGFPSKESCEKAFIETRNNKDHAKKAIRGFTPMTVNQFRDWLSAGDLSQVAEKAEPDRFEKERWVTLESGTHVALDGNGDIVAGPPSLVNKNLDRIDKSPETSNKRPAKKKAATKKPAPQKTPTKPKINASPGAAAAITKMFGGKATSEDVAAIVGAMDGATVTIRDQGNGNIIHAIVEGDGYKAERYLLKKGFPPPPSLVLKQEEIKVDKDRQGQGIGTRVFASQVDAASQHGVNRMECFAAGSIYEEDWNGYSTWPKFGYDGFLSSVMKEKLPPEFADAKKVSDLMRTTDGIEWWRENGQGMDMSFDLKEGSHARRFLQKYLERKGIVSNA